MTAVCWWCNVPCAVAVAGLPGSGGLPAAAGTAAGTAASTCSRSSCIAAVAVVVDHIDAVDAVKVPGCVGAAAATPCSHALAQQSLIPGSSTAAAAEPYEMTSCVPYDTIINTVCLLLCRRAQLR